MGKSSLDELLTWSAGLHLFVHRSYSRVVVEHAGWEVFHQLLRSGELPPRLCTDAYLAALAIANGWRLVSFDRDFERFEGLERLVLR